MKNKKIKKLNLFAFPLLIQFLTSYIIGVTDQAIIARISISSFNAIGLVMSTLSMIAGVLGSITIIFNIKGGTKLGKNDKNGINYEFNSSLLLSFILGSIFFIIFMLGKEYFLSSVYNLKDDSLSEALIFSVPMSFYLMLQLFLFTFGTYFKIINKTKWILLGSLLSATTNVILDYLFVLGKFGMPKLGIRMAGISTILSMLIQLFLYLLVSKNNLHIDFFNFKKYKKNSFIHLKESLPLIGEDIFNSGFFVLGTNMIIIRIGKFEYAGYMIICNLIGFLMLSSHIYSSATLTLTSISYGKKEYNDLIEYPKYSTKITFIIYSILALIFILFKNKLPAIITNDLYTQTISKIFLPYFIIGNILGPWSNIYRSSLQALGESKFVLCKSSIVKVFILIIMFVLSVIFNFSLYGIAISIFIGDFIIGIIYYNKYNSLVNSINQIVDN